MEIAGRTTDLLAQGTRYSRFFSIRDRDYLTEAQRRQLMNDYPGLLILDRYHIENYLLVPEAIAAVMRDAGYHDLADTNNVTDTLEQIAYEIRDAAIADWVRYQLDQKLGGFLLRSGGEKAVEVLKTSAQNVLNQVIQEFNETAIDSLIKEREEFVESEWSNQIWLIEFPGRDLLRRFVGTHVGGIKPREFTNLLLSAVARTESEEKEALRRVLEPLF
jgi:hypothetical protein